MKHILRSFSAWCVRSAVVASVCLPSIGFSQDDLSVREAVVAFTVACGPAADGLVSWWPAEATARDIAGTNNGTLRGGASFSPGEVGQAFVFNGSNSFVQVPDSPSLEPTGPFTIEGWVNYSQLTGINGGTVVMKGPDTEVPADWCISISAIHKLRPHVNLDGGWYYFDCSTTVNPGTWYHIALVYDGASIRGYVNGIQDGSISASGKVRISNYPMKIGAYASQFTPALTSFFDGKIDELSIYNRALTAPELQSIYSAGSAGKCSPPPVVIVKPDQVQAIIDSLAASGGGAPGKVSAMAHNGNMHLHFSATQGGTYIVEASSNLVKWVKVGVATDLGDGTFEYNYLNAAQTPAQFFRVTAP